MLRKQEGIHTGVPLAVFTTALQQQTGTRVHSTGQVIKVLVGGIVKIGFCVVEFSDYGYGLRHPTNTYNRLKGGARDFFLPPHISSFFSGAASWRMLCEDSFLVHSQLCSCEGALISLSKPTSSGLWPLGLAQVTERQDQGSDSALRRETLDTKHMKCGAAQTPLQPRWESLSENMANIQQRGEPCGERTRSW